MMRSIGTIAVSATLVLGAAWPGVASAQTTSATRTSSFCYDLDIIQDCTVISNTGLLNREVIEPDTPALKLQTDHTRDAFGNFTQTQVSGIDIPDPSNPQPITTSTIVYDSNNQFPVTQQNALHQSESWVYDPKF